MVASPPISQQAAERAHDKSYELQTKLFEAATKDAHIVITVILGINGGSAAALLAFSGSLLQRGKPVTEIISILHLFVFGVVSAAVSAVCAYLANSFYSNINYFRRKDLMYPYVHDTPSSKKWSWAAYIFHGIGVVAAIAGVVLFVCGMLKIQDKLGNLLP